MTLTTYFDLVKEHLGILGVAESDFELYYQKASEISAQSYQLEIDQFSQSVAGGISLRVL